jgi:hypothetical protein
MFKGESFVGVWLIRKLSFMAVLILTLVLTLTACSKTGTGNSNVKNETCQSFESSEENIEKNNSASIGPSNTGTVGRQNKNTEKEEMKITLENYEQAGVFSMQKPKGWSVYKAGEYNTLSFLARDEEEPLRQFFCFSEIGPFYISEQQKEYEKSYVASGGYQIQWLDMPVVSPLNGTSFLQSFNDILMTDIGKGFLSLYGMPKPEGFEKISVCSEKKLPGYFEGMGTALVRTLLFSNGEAAEGLFVVSGAPDAYGHAYAFMVTGITMPKDEFNDTLPTLLKAVESFTIDPDYLKEGMRKIAENGEMLKQISNTLSQTSDSMIDYWNNRSRSEDIWSEKESDKNLGYERVYDENTGEVYQVQNGFYDYYQTHEDQYPDRRLQPLGDDDYDLWTSVPRTDNSLVIP